MKKRALSAVLAMVVLFTGTAFDPAYADTVYDIDVTVNTRGVRKEISPYIYGINSQFREEEYLYDVTAGSARQGGNRFTGYNWETNYSNAGRDWTHNSDAYLVDFKSDKLAIPGCPALEFAREAASKNVPYKITTIQMAGYVCADKNGDVSEGEAAPSARWKEVKAVKGSDFSLTPDTSDNYVYMDEYVNYLVENLGDSTTSTGYQGYNLDNEPSLWDATHPRIHSAEPTCTEIVTKTKEYAAAIKSVDPNAETFGPALFGFGAYYDFNSCSEWSSVRGSHDWFISYYLEEMAKAEEQSGKRLLDVLDIHYYSEAKGQCRAMQCVDYTHTDCIEAMVQSPRSLYDPTYIENSWIGDYYQEYLPILTNVNKSIDQYYPGTKLALTEYNFGGGNHVCGAVTEADALGVFASNGVYVANLWQMHDNIDYQLAAIDLYTNYDGNGAAFGDTLVSSSTSDIEKATCYASINGDDESVLTLVLTNKSLTDTQNAHITLDSGADYSSARVYGITGNTSDIQLLDTVNGIDGNAFDVTVPVLSVVQIEIIADDYVLTGDVNSDGRVDSLDARVLSEYITAVPGMVISMENAALTADGRVNVFDLTMLKKKLDTPVIPEEQEEIVAFWASEGKTGQWRVKDGVNGKTITLTFTAEAGNKLNLGYGYWDGAASKWIHNDTTKFGKIDVGEDGKALLTFTVPESAQSVEIMLYNYTNEITGTIEQLDVSLVTLDKVVVSG